MKAHDGQLTHGSLFAGIGGFDLGFERAGIKTVWQVEIDPFCRKVLEKHWPNVERFDDVRECCPYLLRWKTGECAECGRRNWLRWVDVITGGFPCQDVSAANPDGEGLDGNRSGLWAGMFRIISALRPKIVVVENVANLLRRGIERVLGDLASIRYDAQWQCIPASAFGAPHSRDRIWIVAYPEQAGLPADLLASSRAFSEGVERAKKFWNGGWLHEPPGQHSRWLDAAPEARVAAAAWEHATYKPMLLGVPDGISERVDRIGALGNAVVPQIAQWIGERIKAVIE